MNADAYRRIRDFYAITPGAPIYKREFGFYVMDRWIAEGKVKTGDDLEKLFDYNDEAFCRLYAGGMMPRFEVKVLENRGEYEVEQDAVGRKVLYFKGRRNGFMPEYLDHAVKDFTTWERDVKWRFVPDAPGRLENALSEGKRAKKASDEGFIVVDWVIGGYMYLRELIGAVPLLYMFYDNPALILDCMKTWFDVADAVIAEHQKSAVVDELALDEDICYNHGSLISPDMIKEFLLPYYSQLYENVKKRNSDRTQKVHFQVATDGYSDETYALYRSIGVDFLSPFEAASGCNIIEMSRRYPDLLISGGIDKRLIAAGGDAIKRHLEDIMPFMRARGGYIPTCDHGVPEETSFDNYLLYRRLMKEY
jgi:uroporphyrinogen decarboxylase